MLSVGIEPTLSAPQADVLSIERREQTRDTRTLAFDVPECRSRNLLIRQIVESSGALNFLLKRAVAKSGNQILARAGTPPKQESPVNVADCGSF